MLAMPDPSRRLLRPLALMAALAGPVAVLAAPSTAHAADSCKTVAGVGSKVWEETPPVVKNAIASSGPFGATAIKAIKLLDEGVKIWNKIVKDTSVAKIGARAMGYGEWNNGTLIGSTERMFVTPMPAINPVQIDFHKLGHDGKVKVVVCQVPEKGAAKAVRSFTVEAGAPNGLVKSIKLNKAKGHVITVVLHGKSVTKSLKYKVRTKLIFENAEDNAKTVTAPRTDNTVSAPREDNTVRAPRNDGSVSAPR